MADSPGGKRKPSASPQTSRNPSSNDVQQLQEQDGFTKVETKEERRKRKKVEKRRPQFQFDMSAFRSGKKVGMAVSPILGESIEEVLTGLACPRFDLITFCRWKKSSVDPCRSQSRNG